MSTIIQTVLFRRTWEMGKSREEAAETRKRIVQAAARQFREKEIAATGLAELMKAAGLTHGGFYKHFASKDQLVAEATAAAVDPLLKEIAAHPTFKSAVAAYLSPRHRDNPASGCPLAALGDECQTARNRDPGSASKRDPSPALGQACPGSEQEGPARVEQRPHEPRSGARGRGLFAHRGKPGWHSGAVFEAPALVAGFDDFTMMGQAIEERRRHKSGRRTR